MKEYLLSQKKIMFVPFDKLRANGMEMDYNSVRGEFVEPYELKSKEY